MSNKENQAPVLSKDDISNIQNFFKHFKIPIPDFLSKEIEVFTNDPDNYTLDKQQKFKSAISHAMLTGKHEIFENPVWVGVLKNCDEEHFNAQFEKDLEEALTED